jgi:hypothetical protein
LQSGRPVNVNDGRPETWLGSPGHEGTGQTGSPQRIVGRDLGSETGDIHAAGTPGGGSAIGGLAGTNVGGGAPDNAKLEGAMGSGTLDDQSMADDEEDNPEAYSGRSGGAVGGTPANKRAKGGKIDSPPKPSSKAKRSSAQSKSKKRPPR